MICFSMKLAKQLAVMLMVALGAISHPTFAQAGSQALPVQAAQLSDYSRLGFGIPEGTTYRLDLAGTRLRLILTGNYAPDFSAIRSAGLRQIGNPSVSRTATETILSFDVLPNVSPRDFRSGNFLIIDVYGGRPGAVLPSPGQSSSTVAGVPSGFGAAAAPATQAAAPDAEDGPQTSADGTTASAGADSDANAAGPANADTAAEGPDATSETKTIVGGAEDAVTLNTSSDPEPITELQKAPAAIEEPTQLSSAGVTDVAMRQGRTKSVIVYEGFDETEQAGGVPVEVTAIESGVAIAFNWPESVASAVFERGGVLWMVFDQPNTIDPTGFLQADNLLSRRVQRIERRPHQDAMVLRMGISPNQSAVVERDQNRWVINLKDTPAKPRFPLKPERRMEGQGQQIYIAATDIGRKIEVEDPDVGDLVIILPMHKQGNGLAENYNYATAELRETAQGVAITPLTDFIDIERFNDGVIIRSSGNDILSASRLSRATGIGANMQTGFSRLIDFANWRIGEDWEYRKNKSKLLYELSVQSMGDRNGVRWKLARYYLAHGRAAESLGVLGMMLTEDPLLSKNTEYLAVRGVANFKQGRLQEALTDLSARELEAEQDAELWRALVTEALGQYPAALEHYRRGRDVMGTYDMKDRAEIQLAVIRAAVETGNLELALQELSLLNGLELTEAQVAESVYQAARVAEQQGQYETAYTQYDDLSDSRQRWIAARARYSRVKFGLKNGDINAEYAIDQLERLRYAWRGDRFESLLLDDLANLYFSIGKYEDGLESLRQGISYYPELARDRQMLTRMGEVFRYLFLDSGADQLTPVAAISLFYKFRDLTPLGAEGDLMIRRLADRLVSVDLLSRAAELLEYQVQARTEGAARAQVAASLAKIYILDSRPQDALGILRATREPQLPEDVITNRLHVETRTLIELKHYEEAEVLIEQDRSTEADTLRADIYWGAKDWTRLTATIRRLLGDGWRRNEPLTAVQRMNLIRLSIAMTFTEDRAGLIEMRRRYSSQMRTGDFANAFNLLTNDQELSSSELGSIASQIAGVEKLQSFMRDYRNDFAGK